MTTDTLAARYVKACEAGNIGLRARLEDELEAQGRAANERLERPGALLAAALWYAKRGIAVFPCEPRGKRPLTAQGFKDASLSADVIQGWWAKWPTANIGAPTGLTFDVIDVDGGEGVGAIYGEGGPTLPPEIGHVLTTRAGGHHIYIAPTGRGNKAGFLPNVDYRGAGGYVILPPSIGANGRRYMWTRPLQVAL
jgi:hypothetical protein